MLVLPLADAVPPRTAPTLTLVMVMALAAAFMWWPQAPGRELFSGGVHALVTLLFFWIFAAAVEDRLGRLRLAALGLACGVVAGTVETLTSSGALVAPAGVIGAVAGVLGAYLALVPYSQVLTLVWLITYIDIVEIPAFFYITLWFVAQLVFSVGVFAPPGGGVTIAGYASGFVMGVALGRLLRRPERLRIEWNE